MTASAQLNATPIQPIPDAQLELRHLLNAIYDAALQPSQWQDVQHALTRSQVSVTRRVTTAAHAGTNMDVTTLHASYSLEENGESVLLCAWPGTSTPSPQQLSDLYNGAHDLLEPTSGEFLPAPGHRTVTIVRLHRSARHHDLRLAELYPHLLRAQQITQSMQGLAHLNASQHAALNAQTHPMIGLNAQGHVTWTNAAAQRLLSRNNPLMLHGPALRATQAREQQALTIALQNAAQQDATYTSPTLTFSSDTEILYSGTLTPNPGGQGVTLTLRELKSQRRLCPDTLHALYHLTPAETRVALLLSDGLSVQEIAQHAGAAIHTVRNQLKQVFAKTQTTRQSELVRLMMNLS